MWLDHLILFLGWALFYSLHSILLLEKVKNKIGLKPRTYRVLYNSISFLLIVAVLFVGAIIPSPLIFKPSPVAFYAGLMLSTVGIFVIKRAFRNYSTGVFLGIKKEGDNPELKMEGLQSRIRHPLYTGTLMIFIGYFVYNPLLSSAVTLISLFIYLPIGIRLEEQKLIKKFGEQYLSYKRNVPSLFPKITFSKSQS
ncbi:methyltransferase family protein [Roseivirga sp.]|uniref:methyltransferase family protein n=1 Tax=Roseivirga sp. TaxID=1964215 RepID=UPI003B8DB7A8